jgi:methyl-accepting chemotaxis protein
MIHHDIPVWVYIVFTAVTAVGVMMQALVLLGMLFALKGALKRVEEITHKAEDAALPLLESTRDLLKDVSPKLKVTTQNLMEASQTAREISQTVRTESARMAVTVDDLLKKVSGQADRVDEMVTATLNSVAHATATVQRTVSGPVRQVGAVLDGLRAGFEVLRRKERAAEPAHAGAGVDGDNFV